MSEKIFTPKHEKKLNKELNRIGGKLDYFAGRWEDEKEYEDWSDYEAALKGLLTEDFTFVKAVKKPFGVQFTYDGFTCKFYATNTAIKYSVELPG